MNSIWNNIFDVSKISSSNKICTPNYVFCYKSKIIRNKNLRFNFGNFPFWNKITCTSIKNPIHSLILLTNRITNNNEFSIRGFISLKIITSEIHINDIFNFWFSSFENIRVMQDISANCKIIISKNLIIHLIIINPFEFGALRKLILSDIRDI